MNKELTIKQKTFLDSLMSCNGDPKKAAELAGYAEGSYVSVVKGLKKESINKNIIFHYFFKKNVKFENL